MMGKPVHILIVSLLFSQMALGQKMIDPTKPQGFIAGSAAGEQAGSTIGSSLIVSAVFIKGDSKRAVINGDSVIEGQNWKGNTVKKIHKSGVVLIVQGRETELFVNQFSIKKDATNDF